MKYNNADFVKHYATGNAKEILLRRAINQQGLTHVPVNLYRYVVLDVISDPQLFNKGTPEEIQLKTDYWRSIGVTNINYSKVLPRNTIVAQRINDVTSSQNEEPMFLFPFFPSHLALPCKPGEHVWVMFESHDNRELGYWMCKITEVGHVDDVNHTHPPRAYDPAFFPGSKALANGQAEPTYNFRVGKPSGTGDEAFTLADTAIIDTDDEAFYETLLTVPDAAQTMVYEPVPRFRKRPGDIAIEGSNNTLIVLGTDRTGPYADTVQSSTPNAGKVPTKRTQDMQESAGAIDLVVGRGQTAETSGKEVKSKKLDGTDFKNEIGKSAGELSPQEGDPDWKNDRSRVLISQRTKVDTNLGLSSFNQSAEISGVADPDKGSGAIVIKSDKIRIVARMDVEILVSGFESDDKGNARSLEDAGKYAAIVIKSNGDIVFRPSSEGFIKLGGDDANLAILCNTSVPGSPGVVQSTPIIDTMGGSQGQGGAAGQFATKVLIK
jgi:hypothetical protein